MESKENKTMKERKVEKNESGNKKKGFHRFLNSIKNSWDGYVYAYTNEQSLTIHAILAILVIFSGFYFHASRTQWTVIVLVMTIVVIAELLNTAIEAVVDLVTEEYHPLAKIAKDCASAAVFTSSILAAGLYIYVFLPQIIKLFWEIMFSIK